MSTSPSFNSFFPESMANLLPEGLAEKRSTNSESEVERGSEGKGRDRSPVLIRPLFLGGRKEKLKCLLVIEDGQGV